MKTSTLYNYQRRKSNVVEIGDIPLGGENPIRLQSMTNTNTLDTDGSVEQAIRIIKKGASYVRLTAQGVREAANLQSIREGLHQKGYTNPLVADIHFNPKAADEAALHVEKVRINPGNYVDSARTFKQLSYTDEEYACEIEKIRSKLVPFLRICKEHHTAIRIGVNHGSLSDRIMSRYGDTPQGMVESCMEFLRICVQENFFNVVLSVKSSNTVIMVKTVRLLVDSMKKEHMFFPLHLGVTEAGDGEDGRIKSAIGIGALLSDGIGDTIRVSLSEAPEAELPVAKALVDYITNRKNHTPIFGPNDPDYNPIDNTRRYTHKLRNIGEGQSPIVIADYSATQNQGTFNETFKADYIYIGQQQTLPDSENDYIVDATNPLKGNNLFRLYDTSQYDLIEEDNSSLKFLRLSFDDISLGSPHNNPMVCMHVVETIDLLKEHPEIVVIIENNNANIPGETRAFVFSLQEEGITNPIILHGRYCEDNAELLPLKAAADFGVNLIDQLADGIMISNQGCIPATRITEWMFGILQAARLRTSKTEYISCPGCGRTLFDLQQTIARVKKATAHLTGLKIGIMGCIVNGPGEMADADYGYVGAGRNRISLYKNKICMEKNIPEELAVDKLIELIKKNGDWKD